MNEPREWLILEPDGRLYWREKRNGYSDLLGAGLYSEKEATSIEGMGRGDKKVHVSAPDVQRALEHARQGLRRFSEAARLPQSAAAEGILSALRATITQAVYEGRKIDVAKTTEKGSVKLEIVIGQDS